MAELPAKYDKETQKLLAKAEKGDPEAMKEMLKIVEEKSPTWFIKQDVANDVESLLIKKVAGNEYKFSQVGTRRRQAHLRKELAGDGPTSPLEELLIQRVAICWLQAYLADLMELKQLNNEADFQTLEYCRKRQDATHKRLLSAVKALAQVRRLQLPVIQFNVAEKQVNFISKEGVSDLTGNQ